MKRWIFAVTLAIFVSTTGLADTRTDFAARTRANQVFQTLKQQMQRTGDWERFSQVKTKREMLAYLKRVQHRVPLARQLLHQTRTNPNLSLGFTIDPCDLACLNCIGVHCPECEETAARPGPVFRAPFD